MTNKLHEWTEQDLKFLKENYSRFGAKYCANILNKSINQIRIKASKEKFKFLGILSLDDRDFIRKYFPIFGRSYCCEKLNKRITDIEAFVLRAGIKSNPITEFNSSLYIDHYINLWTPDIVYILGLIWADGHLRKHSKNAYQINFTLTENDAKTVIYNLEKFYPFLWKHYKIKPSIAEINGRKLVSKPAMAFVLSDKYIGKFLYDNDYHIKSGASADKILGKIPDHLKHYWWRGYFDGDGWIDFDKKTKLPRVGIASVINQDWTFFYNLCERLNITPAKLDIIKKDKQNSSRFLIRRKNDVIKFCEYIYKNRENDKIGFERKYTKYKNANLQWIEKTSEYKGVCLDKSKNVNPWITYYQGKYIGCAATPEQALELRNNHIKKLQDKCKHNQLNLLKN